MTVGAGAVATAEAWAHRTQLHTWYINETGGCGPPPPNPPQADVAFTEGTLRSRTVAGDVGYIVSIPQGAQAAKLPLVICLPGRGGTGSSTIKGLRLADYAGLAPHPLALASVDGGESYWHPRASGEDRMAMLVDEFVPLLRSRYHLGAAGTGILGISMGGYGAILAAELYPQTFTALAALSAAMWPSRAAQASAVSDAFDSAADYARYDPYTHIRRLDHTPVFIGAGASDPFRAADVEFAHRLQTPPTTYWAAGCHDGRFWQNAAGPALKFLSIQLAP